MKKITAADERHRFDLSIGLLQEQLRLLDSLARGPGGRHLRHCRGADGKALFAWVKAGEAEYLVPTGMIEVLRAVKAARPAVECGACRTEGCPACRSSGYLPADVSIVSRPDVEHGPPAEDASDVWGRLRGAP